MSILLSKFKSSYLFQVLRKIKYRNKRKDLANETKLNIGELESILIERFKIQQGDSLIIHCGFGFLNADFSPVDLISVLKKLVGINGHIMMPFYPPGLSKDWASAKRVFDPENVRCSTGILAQEFSYDPDVVISHHPIKAVIVWGEKAVELCSNHESCEYPYDRESPYYKLSQLPNSKSIGLGVRNCAMLHCAEDVYEANKDYLYNKEKAELSVLINKKQLITPTFYHHGNINLITPSSFIERYCAEVVCSVTINSVVFYVINNDELLNSCKEQFLKGNNRSCQ
jgi:aminoglycoside N3'-acetyltransferase